MYMYPREVIQVYLPELSTQKTQALNSHLLALKSRKFSEEKQAYYPRNQLGQLLLVADHQLAQQKVKQSHCIYLSALVPLGGLLYPMVNLLDAVTSKPYELHDNTADFGEVGFILIQSGMLGQ